jgi:hypothetical protein
MYDNKIRLSQDVLDKAEVIAQEWGLKNARAAVEAVFRRYADEYLGRRSPLSITPNVVLTQMLNAHPAQQPAGCDALNELDDLLGL